MNCLEAQSKIMAFIENKMEDEETLAFVEHIRSCDNCAEELEIYYTMLVGIKRLDEDKELTVNFKHDMEQRLDAEYRHVMQKRKLSAGTIILAAAILISVFFVTYKSYQDTAYLATQVAIKNNQGEAYYADCFSEALYRDARDTRLNLDLLIRQSHEAEDEEELTYYETLRNYTKEHGDESNQETQGETSEDDE